MKEYIAKPVMISITGSSGSGKTTLANMLEEEYGVQPIVSYTTRPKRPQEQDGKEHYFVADPSQKPGEHELFAYTKYGDYEYWTTKRQIYDTDDVFSYVIDERGLEELKTNYSDMFDLIAVRVYRDNLDGQISEERLKRDEGRLNFPDEYYDIVVKNDSDLDTMREIVNNVIVPVINEKLLAQKFEQTVSETYKIDKMIELLRSAKTSENTVEQQNEIDAKIAYLIVEQNANIGFLVRTYYGKFNTAYDRQILRLIE